MSKTSLTHCEPLVLSTRPLKGHAVQTNVTDETQVLTIPYHDKIKEHSVIRLPSKGFRHMSFPWGKPDI